MKKFILVLGASCLLAGCGSQNLAPLEDKTTKLRDNNHQLKLDIQQLNEDISNQKSKIAGLQQDKENSKKTSSNKLKIKNLKASSDYYDKIANAIGDYRNVESDVSKNKGKKDVQDKLDKISNEIDEAYSKYKSSIDSDSKSEEDKQKRKEISIFDKDLSSAMDKIRNGYQSKDSKQIKKGQQKLATVSSNIS
ncbi:hypothetical protein [Staphylococcus caprae]|uniref:hypothetical protein n=1 Tax=Staphylococcus caprae TaxID=29380 RepID=UPI0005CB2B88|nr:hypothetical protein [Staphylococcus caprae]